MTAQAATPAPHLAVQRLPVRAPRRGEEPDLDAAERAATDLLAALGLPLEGDLADTRGGWRTRWPRCSPSPSSS